MKRKRRISRLMREIKRLRKENKQLHDKHWNECRQIALYDDEVRRIKGSATIRDFSRMCRANKDCEICPMTKAKLAVDYEYSTCAEMMTDHPDEANEAILKWCAEHPEQPESVSEQPESVSEQPESVSGQPTKKQKTYKEDLLEKLPNVVLLPSGHPNVCRNVLYDCYFCNDNGCNACWNEVMPDADE